MADIRSLYPFIQKWEGGFVNDPADAGGATNKGVTIATWRAHGYDINGDGVIDVEDLKLISDNDMINVIMKPHYWDKWKADQIQSQKIANILVDWVWGSGSYGIKIPQRILGVKPDGIVGPITLAAINAEDPDVLFAKIYQERLDYIERICVSRPLNRKFRRGWINRLEDLRRTFDAP